MRLTPQKRSIVDEIAMIRRNLLSKAFTDALTRGGPGGFPRPIEMHAHDPLRYVGDMLAWVHQSLASEREMLVTLLLHSTTSLKDSVDRGMEDEEREDEELDLIRDIPGFLEPVSVNAMLEKVMDGIGRPLKVFVFCFYLPSHY